MAVEPDPVDIHVGQRLRLRRSLLGMSQERLGELLGLTFQQIQKYERGANRIGSSRLFEIGRILGVPVAWFFEGLDDRPLPEPGADTSRRQALAEAPATTFVVEHGLPVEAASIERRETLELVRAFNRIADPLIRRRLFELAKALGRKGADPQAVVMARSRKGTRPATTKGTGS